MFIKQDIHCNNNTCCTVHKMITGFDSDILK